ncbi:transposase family protein [Halomonas getboli]|uniref:transposase family protein n=1 Tax=Halomonas getboli TaxID=2935862 RepID=UPI003CD0CE36
MSDILFLTACAVICGAKDWDKIENFSHAKLDFSASTALLRPARPLTTRWPE